MSAAAELRDRVLAMPLAPGQTVAICTDAQTFPNHVLVAVRVPGAACVFQVARSEYDGFAIMKILGIEQGATPPIPEAKTRAKTQTKGQS